MANTTNLSKIAIALICGFLALCVVCLAEAEGQRGTTTLPEAALLAIRGTNPDIGADPGYEVCEDNTSPLGGFVCDSCPTKNLGNVTCTCCEGTSYLSGAQLQGTHRSVMPSGGANIDCSHMEEYQGTCNNGACENQVDKDTQCIGQYVPMLYEALPP